ncbi:hypothetical protein B9Z55_005248 [Caenorhabditis nigoni]|nr:hypothetical protein B9Z55_005248 [Caenorhabditis nigoni]
MVQLREDYATNTTSLWIDGKMIRFESAAENRVAVFISGESKAFYKVPRDVIGRCVEAYLNHNNIYIIQLTIRNASWPTSTFFPKKVASLKLIVNRDISDSLRNFKNMTFPNVIVDNYCKQAQILALPMVHMADQLTIKSQELDSLDLIEMPLNPKSKIQIHQTFEWNETFTQFCEKLLEWEEVDVGLCFTASAPIRSNFSLKRLLAQIDDTIRETRKTMWNGRKSWTLNLRNNKELVIFHRKTGSILQPKHHVTAIILEKGASTDRDPRVRGTFSNIFNQLKIR